MPGVLHSHHCKYRNTHRRGNGTEIPPAEMYINTKHQQRLFVLHKQLLCSRTVPFFGCVYHRFFHLELQQITANGFSEVKKEANKFLRRFALLRFSTQHNPRISGSHRGWGCSGAPLPLHPSHRVSRSELRRRGTSAPCLAGQRRSGAGPCGERCAQLRGAALGPRADGAAREPRGSPSRGTAPHPGTDRPAAENARPPPAAAVPFTTCEGLSDGPPGLPAHLAEVGSGGLRALCPPGPRFSPAWRPGVCSTKQRWQKQRRDRAAAGRTCCSLSGGQRAGAPSVTRCVLSPHLC